MKAFINTRFLNQTQFDSAAPWGAAVVAVELDKQGAYELAVARRGEPFVRLPFAVGPEPALRDEDSAPVGAPDADMRRAVTVDLLKLARPGATLPQLPSLARAGWVSFTSAQPLPDHHVALRPVDGGEEFDSRKLGERAVFGLTLIRPGRYSLQNTIARTKAEIVVTYPKVGKTPYRPADPLQVEATKDGFGEPTFTLGPGQGMVCRFRTESRIQIDLVEPDDGPERDRGPSSRLSRLTPDSRSA